MPPSLVTRTVVKAHVLQIRMLQWAHGFDPEWRDAVDEVQASFLSDYADALDQKGDAFKVAREMLKYQLRITEDPADLLKRDEVRARLIKEHPFVAKKKSGGGKRGGGGGRSVAAAKEERKKSGV